MAFFCVIFCKLNHVVYIYTRTSLNSKILGLEKVNKTNSWNFCQNTLSSKDYILLFSKMTFESVFKAFLTLMSILSRNGILHIGLLSNIYWKQITYSYGLLLNIIAIVWRKVRVVWRGIIYPECLGTHLAFKFLSSIYWILLFEAWRPRA